MQPLHKTLAGVAGVVAAAAVIGLAWNWLRPNGLPLVRKPLHETRKVVHIDELVPQPPIADASRPAAKQAEQAPRPSPPVEKPAEPAKSVPEPVVVQPRPSENQRITAPVEPVKPKQRREPKSQASASRQKTARTTKAKPVTQPGSKQKPVTQPRPKSTATAKPRPEPAPIQVLPPPKKPEALFTTLEDAKKCFDNRSAIFLDARPIEDYRAGHVAGALSLYFGDLNNSYARVLGGVPKDRLIVTYCSDPECASAVKLADALCERGHTQVVILLEGLPGWKEAGYPVATGREPGS